MRPKWRMGLIPRTGCGVAAIIFLALSVPSAGAQIDDLTFRTPAPVEWRGGDGRTKPSDDPNSTSAVARVREFQTPSRRIACRYTSKGGPGPFIRCDVLSLNDTGFILDRRHKAKRITVTDTAADTTKAPILRYGKSRRFGTFRCRSQRSGLTCKSLRSGHGFKLSREEQRLF